MDNKRFLVTEGSWSHTMTGTVVVLTHLSMRYGMSTEQYSGYKTLLLNGGSISEPEFSVVPLQGEEMRAAKFSSLGVTGKLIRLFFYAVGFYAIAMTFLEKS